MKPLDESTDELVTELFGFTLPSNSTPLQEKIRKAITAARIEGAKVMQEVAAVRVEAIDDNFFHKDRAARCIRAIDPATVVGGGK